MKDLIKQYVIKNIDSGLFLGRSEGTLFFSEYVADALFFDKEEYCVLFVTEHYSKLRYTNFEIKNVVLVF